MSADKQTIHQKLIDQGYQQAVTVILPNYGVVLHTEVIPEGFWLIDPTCGPEVVIDIDALSEILAEAGVRCTPLSRKTFRELSLAYRKYESNQANGLYAKIESGVLKLVTLYEIEEVPLHSTHGGEFHVFWKDDACKSNSTTGAITK